MSKETECRLTARVCFMSEAIKTASNDLLRIEGLAGQLIDEANPNKDAINTLKDIVFLAVRGRSFLSEASQ